MPGQDGENVVASLGEDYHVLPGAQQGGELVADPGNRERVDPAHHQLDPPKVRGASSSWWAVTLSGAVRPGFGWMPVAGRV